MRPDYILIKRRDTERPEVRRGISVSLLFLCVSVLNGSTLRAQGSAAAKYSADHSGDAVLVFQHDSLVFEQYQNGWKADAPHPLASGTKTFACILTALNPQITQIGTDSVLRGVTVRQLLDLTSGLSVDKNGQLIRVSPPGRKFAYGGVSFAIYALMVRQKLGEDFVTYLTREVFEPLGIKPGPWQRDEAGNPGLASGASLTAREWGKIGLLLLNRGRLITPAQGRAGTAAGRQLVPAAGLAECAKGSDANPYYGMGLWLNPAQPLKPPAPGIQRADSTDRIISAPNLPHDLMLAAGAGGQRLYILPTQGLVVVRFGHNTGPDYRDEEFLRMLLNSR